MPKINKEFYSRMLVRSRFGNTGQLGRAAGLGGYVPTSRVLNADDPDDPDVQKIADLLGVPVAELTDPAWTPPPPQPSPGRVSLFEVQERAQDFPGFAGHFRDDVLPDPHHWPLGSRRLTDDHGAANVDRLDFDWGEPIDVEGYPAQIPSLSEGEADRLLASLRKQYDFLQAEAAEIDEGVSAWDMADFIEARAKEQGITYPLTLRQNRIIYFTKGLDFDWRGQTDLYLNQEEADQFADAYLEAEAERHENLLEHQARRARETPQDRYRRESIKLRDMEKQFEEARTDPDKAWAADHLAGRVSSQRALVGRIRQAFDDQKEQGVQPEEVKALPDVDEPWSPQWSGPPFDKFRQLQNIPEVWGVTKVVLIWRGVDQQGLRVFGEIVSAEAMIELVGDNEVDLLAEADDGRWDFRLTRQQYDHASQQ